MTDDIYVGNQLSVSAIKAMLVLNAANPKHV
jgi:hypothetical protein